MLLHLYQQQYEHHEAWVVGTRDGLTALRDALTRTLEAGEGSVEVEASDGEGFRVLVVALTQEQGSKLAPPYALGEVIDTLHPFLGEAVDTLHPFQIVGIEAYRRLMSV